LLELFGRGVVVGHGVDHDGGVSRSAGVQWTLVPMTLNALG
jgi:hypothetical protein